MNSDRIERGRRPVAALILALSLLTGISCDPPDLTPELAASAIRQARETDLVYTTYLNPQMLSGCQDNVRFLRHCEEAGLVTLRWTDETTVCGEFAVDLTPAGEEHFLSVAWEGRTDRLYTTKGWRAPLRHPIAVEVIEVSGIEEGADDRRKASYTWKYLYPSMLEGCTRHSQPEVQEGVAFFARSFGRWRIE